MRIRLTLVPAMTLVFAGVLAASAGQATALPAGKQTKIQNCENAIIDAQQDFLGRELGVFSTCAKDFLFANIKDSPAKEAALAAAKTACVAQLNTLDGASSTFIDSVIAGCTPATKLIFTKPSDPTGYQDPRRTPVDRHQLGPGACGISLRQQDSLRGSHRCL